MKIWFSSILLVDSISQFNIPGMWNIYQKYDCLVYIIEDKKNLKIMNPKSYHQNRTWYEKSLCNIIMFLGTRGSKIDKLVK